MPKQPVLIWIVATSFGEVDWLLPVMAAFHKRNPEWKIVTLFGHQIVYQSLIQNSELYDEFAKISSLNIYPQEIDALFAEDIAPEQVRIILKDFNQDEYSHFKRQVEDRCPEALRVSYPHSIYIYSNLTSERITAPVDPDAYSRHDVFLLSSPNDIPYWSKHVDPKKIRAFGYPVFDEWWQEQMLASPHFIESAEKKLAERGGKVFFHVSRHPNPVYLSEKDYHYLIQTMLKEVFAYDDSVLIIKHHPRQDITSFVKLLEPYDPSRWMFSGFHLTQLASIADVVISFWASGIFNSLAVGTPVIEYYRYGDRNPEWRLLPGGERTSIYRELGMAAPANTPEELKKCIQSALEGTDPIWDFQLRAFAHHCMLNENSSDAVAQCLLDELKKKDTLRGLTVKMTVDPVGEGIEQVVELVGNGESDKAGELLVEMAGQYPKDPRVFNCQGVFLFNQGDFIGAVDSLVTSLNLNPQYYEAGANLVHVLMEIEKEKDALDVVISFHSNNPNEVVRTSFLMQLKDQLTEEQFLQIHEGIGRMSTTG